ncbi:MAG: type II toxin-antitoxin system RelE/ParE family toxin [Methylomonas sp.]|nr:type II toxin-antitoxin system RelE/ParE family toxin [Methylomonas sp.]
MAQRLTWSPEAIEDLNSIRDYIARDSLFYARSVVRKVLETAKQIPDAAGIGRVVPEIGDETIRERFVYSYRLVYKLDERQITVVAVIHGKRLLENVSERFN